MYIIYTFRPLQTNRCVVDIYHFILWYSSSYLMSVISTQGALHSCVSILFRNTAVRCCGWTTIQMTDGSTNMAIRSNLNTWASTQLFKHQMLYRLLASQQCPQCWVKQQGIGGSRQVGVSEVWSLTEGIVGHVVHIAPRGPGAVMQNS